MMRHLAAFLLALALAGTACGPRPEPAAPASPTGAPPSSPTGSPVGSPSPGGSPVAEAPPSLAAVRSLWTQPIDQFHGSMLLKSRQEDSPAADIQNMLVENVVKPMGALKSAEPITGEAFAESTKLAVGFYPSGDVNTQERKAFGAGLTDEFWKLQTEKGEVLASVTMAPGADGRPRVQALILKSEVLGSPLSEERESDRKAAHTVLEQVAADDADGLLKNAAPVFRDRLDAQALKSSLAPLRAAVTPDAEPKLVGGHRWHSIVGWTRSYDYEVAGPKGPVKVTVSLDEEDGTLSGLAWTTPDGQTEEI